MSRHNWAICGSTIALLLVVSQLCEAVETAESTPEQVEIVVGTNATIPERFAAEELAKYLRVLYPSTQFQVNDQAGSDNQTIYVGTPKSAPQLKNHLGDRTLAGPESYVVAAVEIDGRPCGLIFGADPAGVVHGVYSLLKRLGCGFYLSFDTLPKPKTEPFSFGLWELSDHPLVPTRLVFNWHNFLSGCSTWNLEHWQHWIAQSQKMGYNGLMVHVYGNNPMAGFSFREQQKPVGYLTSTRIGRDWATNHVNDVRRLWGGAVFQEPVFGCTAAIEGTDLQRTRAAQELMQQVFTEAEDHAMDVYFAVDVDTTSANPPILVEALDESERFQTGECWLVRPDTPGGYAFYRAQVEELLRVYPQLDCLVVWHRANKTPWMSFKAKEMPQVWQDEYARLCQQDPHLEKLWHSVHLFAQAKIVAAFERAVAELGRTDVKIAFGSWTFNFMPAADRFLPPQIELIGLDYNVLHDRSSFDTADRRAVVAQVAKHRSVIPIAWAHHDDGNYVGRPYTPYADFHDKLNDMACADSGFGVIHWTTWPLDLYFESLVQQVWASSKNEPLDVSCARFSQDLIGNEQADLLAKYLHDWVTTMQKVGRETSDRFSDKPTLHPEEVLAELPKVRKGYQRRMARLNQMKLETLPGNSQQHVIYFKGLERFILALYENDAHWIHARRAWEAGKLAEARGHLAQAKPEQVISDFATISQANGITRGEQGLVVTMNTRWLPYFVQLRQQLGMEAVRYNFALTSHDPLAQNRGTFTFLFDEDRALWQTLGREETGLDTFVLQPEELANPASGREILQAGIKSQQSFDIHLGPILTSPESHEAALPPGNYELNLWCASPAQSGEQVFKVNVFEEVVAKTPDTDEQPQLTQALPAPRRLVTDTIQLKSQADAGRVVKREYRLTLESSGVVKLTLEPVKGEAVLNGVSLAPHLH